MSTSDIQSSGAEMEKYAASSAGVLCWSTSSSEHDKSSDKSYSFVQKSDGAVIRIPGPQVRILISMNDEINFFSIVTDDIYVQILGYMLQFTDNDETTPVPEQLPEGFLLKDEDYDDSFRPRSQPSNALNPQRGVDPRRAVDNRQGEEEAGDAEHGTIFARSE